MNTALCFIALVVIDKRSAVGFSTPMSTHKAQSAKRTEKLWVASQDVGTSDLSVDIVLEDDEPVLKKSVEDFLTVLPRHSHEAVDEILNRTEMSLRSLYHHSMELGQDDTEPHTMGESTMTGGSHEKVFANSYVDFGRIDTIGFDFDYTLVTYTEELLDLIYDMTLKRLVLDRQYPLEMLNSGLKFDPRFSIRGLAVDRETGWICHLSYTHKVALAWEGRKRVSTERIFQEYQGKRAMNPSERRSRIKPLNDLFSMAECCLIADTVQFFLDNDIKFCPRNLVNDILDAIRDTHISGDFHRLVAKSPWLYFRPSPHLKDLLMSLKDSSKRLIFVSNSPFWYVDAGMKYVIGANWMETWDAVVTSAGKPSFYTDNNRPFREVCQLTGRIKFKLVEKFEKGSVYTEGCLKELTKLMERDESKINSRGYGGGFIGSNVLYIGDSLFADLVDAKREYGWITAAVTPEVGHEMELQEEQNYILVQRSLDLLLSALRLLQDELGNAKRTEEDIAVLDSLERLVSRWRDRETRLMGNPFGSVFRARYQPSLFAHSLRRYCDLYMSSVSSLRNYSPQHRFYPEDSRLLSHEIRGADRDCWLLEDMVHAATDDGSGFGEY